MQDNPPWILVTRSSQVKPTVIIYVGRLQHEKISFRCISNHKHFFLTVHLAHFKYFLLINNVMFVVVLP